MTERLNEITIVTGKKIFDLKPGEVMKLTTQWWIGCPGCGAHVNITEWSPIEHENSTVTFSPSIWHKYEDHMKCGAHFFIKRNKIQWA